MLSIQCGGNTPSVCNTTVSVSSKQFWSSLWKQCLFLTPLYWRSTLHPPAHVLTLPSVLAAATPGINVEDRCGSRVHTDALAGCDMGRNNSTPFSESAHHTPSTSLPPCRMFLPCWCCTSHQDHTSSLGTWPLFWRSGLALWQEGRKAVRARSLWH